MWLFVTETTYEWELRQQEMSLVSLNTKITQYTVEQMESISD